MRKLFGHNLSVRGRLALGFRLATAVIPGGGGVTPLPPADYVVTADAEWDTVFANSDATLSGKIIDVSGTSFTERTIASGRVFSPAITIRSADDSSYIPALTLDGDHTGVHLDWLNIQIAGWPSVTGYGIRFRNGVGTDFKKRNCRIRHGYGPSLADFDVSADLPEYARPYHPLTVTATSQTIPVTWADNAANDGWVEFQNNGSETVYVRFNNSATDTATAADTACPPNKYTRITGVNPQNAAYCHIVAAANTSDVWFTTDIGLSYYLANAYFREGGAQLIAAEFRANSYIDLGNGFKFHPDLYGDTVVMDNHFDRIYQDIAAGNPVRDTGRLYFMRNTAMAPFSRQGIVNRQGDARDPHGDFRQFFGFSNNARITSAGNRGFWGNIRPGAGPQGGNFWQAASGGGSYQDCFIIGDMYPIASNSAGAFEGPNDHVYVLGNTVVNTENPDSAVLCKMPGSLGNNFVGYNIFGTYAFGPMADHVGNVTMKGAAIASIFPAWTDVPATTDKASIEAALTTAAGFAGAGATAWNHAIDWTTQDHLAVVKWDMLPVGIAFPTRFGVPVSSTEYSPIRKIMAGPATSSIAADAGCEYQITSDMAGTAVVTAWTSAPGTIDRGQFVQVRGPSSASYLTATDIGVTINGEHLACTLKTQVDPATTFDTSPGTYFTGTNIGGGQSKMHFRATMNIPAYPSSAYVFTLSGLRASVEVLGGGNMRLNLRDGAGTVLLSNYSVTGVFPLGVWFDFDIMFDLTAAKIIALVDGVVVLDYDLASVGNGVLDSGRFPSIMARHDGANKLSATVYELSFWLDATADGSTPAYPALHTIYGPAATANADAWKQGADAI